MTDHQTQNQRSNISIDEYIGIRFDDFWSRQNIPTHEKVHASAMVKEAYFYICRKIKLNHKELNADAITDINLLEGFLITFVQFAGDFESLRKIQVIIG